MAAARMSPDPSLLALGFMSVERLFQPVNSELDCALAFTGGLRSFDGDSVRVILRSPRAQFRFALTNRSGASRSLCRRRHVRLVTLENVVIDRVHLRKRLILRVPTIRIGVSLNIVLEVERVVIPKRFGSAGARILVDYAGDYARC